MNCSKCNEEIDKRGIIYHFRMLHNISDTEMISILFDKIDELEKDIINIKKVIHKSPTMSLDLFDYEGEKKRKIK